MAEDGLSLHGALKACRRCVEAGYLVIPPPIFSGNAAALFMIVGQAPGRLEAQVTGQPFSGPAGVRLFRWLAQCGFEQGSFRESQYMTAITKCYPGPNRGSRGDRVPGRQEQALCRPWLEQEMAQVQPQVIVPVGGLAIRTFLDAPGRLAGVVGQIFTLPEHTNKLSNWARQHVPRDACLIPLPHPSGASLWLNKAENKLRVQAALDHLARARRVLAA